MSFLERISGHDYKIMQSITNQIAILFSNRNDIYYSYDFKNKKIIPLHSLFTLDFFSPEFPKKLAKYIEVVEPRVKNLKVTVRRDEQNKTYVNIEGFLYTGEKFPSIKINV